MTGHEIKALRDALKLTQEQFARRIGCATSTLRRWEALRDEAPEMLAIYRTNLEQLARKAPQV